MIHLDSIAHIRKVWSFPQVMSWNCSSSKTEIISLFSNQPSHSPLTPLIFTFTCPILPLSPFYRLSPFLPPLYSFATLLSPPCPFPFSLLPSFSSLPPSPLCRSSSRNNFTFHHLRSPLEFQNNVTVTNKRIHLGRHGWADVPQR